MHTLNNDLKCPVCLNKLTPPVVMCRSGHNTCSQCKSGLHQCSLCREPFLQATNRVLDNILNEFSKTKPCFYLAVGCPSLISFSHHSQICSFRSIQCPDMTQNCAWNGKVKDWISHVEDMHFNMGILLNDEPMKLPKASFLHMFAEGCVLRVKECYYFFQLIKKKCLGNNSTYNLTVNYIPVVFSGYKYLFRVVIQDLTGQISDSVILKPSMILTNQDKFEDGMGATFLLRNIQDEITKEVLITALEQKY